MHHETYHTYTFSSSKKKDDRWIQEVQEVQEVQEARIQTIQTLGAPISEATDKRLISSCGVVSPAAAAFHAIRVELNGAVEVAVVAPNDDQKFFLHRMHGD